MADCRVCGGAGWLDEPPTHPMKTPGNNDCPYCKGTGREPAQPSKETPPPSGSKEVSE